ncbi:unnamed protein product [Strongylus vulgaris]|uniref:Uncharacterized protein n=1 Tax=Strongylus vulgaris TaxID=40348 RepID=A0A3P7JFG5_STRVU|nr:unnamed protein product [Strongylus vulgaris]
MSSLLLARTTCTDVAVTFLNRQHQKQLDRLTQLKANGNGGDAMAREKVLLKDFAVMSRLCALTNKPLPTIQVPRTFDLLPAVFKEEQCIGARGIEAYTVWVLFYHCLYL